MAIVNMSLVTEVQPILRRDFGVAHASLLNPDSTPGTATDPLYFLDGEFVMLNSNYQLARGGREDAASTGGALVNPIDVGSASKVPSFAVWMERGRTDMQAIGKATVLFGSGYEADFHADILNPADTFAVGDALYVNWLSNGTDRNRRRGLTKLHNGTEGLVHGYVTRVFTAGSTYRMRALIVAP